MNKFLFNKYKTKDKSVIGLQVTLFPSRIVDEIEIIKR